jgi:hypothetical protein
MSYKKRIPKAKQTAEPPKPTEEINQTPEQPTTHTQFRKSMEDQLNDKTTKTPIDNQVELEGVGKINISEEPFARPTVERDYTDAGVNSHKTASTVNDKAKADTAQPNPNPQNPKDTAPANDFEPTPPNEEFEPTPPGDEGYAEQHTVNDGGDGTSPFNIPSGSANDLIDFGQKGLNYAIGIFGPMLVGVKLHREFYNFKGAVEQIKEQNEKNTEKIKFDDEDIDMIREPLVAMMQEKGIRGLTNGEKLVVGLLMIGVKKAKIVVEIRKENKILENNLMDLIRSQAPKQSGPKEEPKETEEEIETIIAEEVK